MCSLSSLHPSAATVSTQLFDCLTRSAFSLQTVSEALKAEAGDPEELLACLEEIRGALTSLPADCVDEDAEDDDDDDEADDDNGDDDETADVELH